MKTITGVVLLVIVMGVVVQMRSTDSVYVKEESTVEVQQEEIKEKWQTDEDAIKAAQAVVHKKELQAELDILKNVQASTTDRIKTLEKEIGTYWRDKENVKRLIKETFPENPTVAIAVAVCESGLNPKAYNPHNTDGSVDGGLWQINSTHDKRLEELGLDKYNPEDATRFARILYDESGFKPWVCARKVALR